MGTIASAVKVLLMAATLSVYSTNEIIKYEDFCYRMVSRESNCAGSWQDTGGCNGNCNTDGKCASLTYNNQGMGCIGFSRDNGNYKGNFCRCCKDLSVDGNSRYTTYEYVDCDSGSDESSWDDEALVKAVENTLGECSDIVEAVGDFLAVFETEDDNRRRDEKDESLAEGVAKKLKTCGKVIEAVDTFREKRFFPFSRGHIKLQWSELRFLNQELKSVSKKISETLFIASKDGDAASKFHGACDKKGPTIVIVETTTGNVFGGYTDLSWGTSSGAYVKSSNTFLFRLRPTTKRYDIKEGREGYAIYTNSGYGPTFGGGHDFYIVSSALSSTSSYTNGGHSYVFPSYPNYQLNDGKKNFKVKDYVVVQVVDL